jgi:hypothetical protein
VGELNFFLSHAYADRNIVNKIADDLAARGVRVVLDEATLFLGDSLLERVSATIGNQGYVAVALSPRSVRAAWVQDEVPVLLAGEQSNGIAVLPLLVADCDLPDFLEGRLYADFTRPEQYQENLDLIVRRLGLPDDFRAFKAIGLTWTGPLQLEPKTYVELPLVYFDGSRVVMESHPPAPTGLRVPDDTRVADLVKSIAPGLSVARDLPLDFNDGGWRVVHLESESELRPQRTLRAEGVTSGDHLVLVVGEGLLRNTEVIVRRVADVLREHEG